MDLEGVNYGLGLPVIPGFGFGTGRSYWGPVAANPAQAAHSYGSSVLLTKLYP